MLSRIAVLFLAGALAIQATMVTWTLANAQFSDGGTATGSFVYDAASQTVLSYSILASGGNEVTFPAFLFQNGVGLNRDVVVDPALDVLWFRTWYIGFGTYLHLVLTPLAGLTDAGGTVNLDLTNLRLGECYNCNPWRGFVSGQMVGTPGATAIPEPATGGAVLLALGALWGAAKMIAAPRRKLRR